MFIGVATFIRDCRVAINSYISIHETPKPKPNFYRFEIFRDIENSYKYICDKTVIYVKINLSFEP